MRRIFNILVSISAVLWISSCEQLRELEETSVVEEGLDAAVRLSYGSNVDKVEVTKAGLTPTQESAIYSIYVMTFNQNGARTNNATDALFYRTDTQTSDRTWVDQSTEGNYSKGYIQFNAKTGANTTVYAVANVNTPAMSGLYSLSSDDLDKVKTLDDLKALTVGLNSNSVTRGSQMMMLGILKDSETATEPKKITINSSTTVQEYSTLYFERQDAKVQFNVSIHPDVAEDAEFELDLHSWQVFNVPYNANLVTTDILHDGLTKDEGLKVFNTSRSNQFDSGNSFTFYMLENNLAPVATLESYADREKKNKGDDGAYTLTDGEWSWLYSNEMSTYVQIKGRLSYKQNVENSTTKDHIHADFVYNVHLGNFSESVNNFWTKPNTHYTYNVYVKSVNNIITEVETSNNSEPFAENQPGAEGNVVKASGSNIYEVDAHYAQILIPFTYDSSFLDAMGENSTIDELTWYISSPYSEGTYSKNENNAETKHYDLQYLDYKWVEFYINSDNQMVTYGEYLKWLQSKGRATVSNNVYTKTNPLYINELVDELKAWYKYMKEESTIKPSIIEAGTPGNTQTIYVTAFVNEFYYDNGNPLSTTDNDVAAMVRKVVNTDDRYMHILSNVQYSDDGASSLTNSAATIIQKPIRSIYNIPDFGLIDGYDLIWGTETISEQYGDNKGLLFGAILNQSASSNSNGRLNTYYLWGSGAEKWENRMEISNNVWTMRNANTANANPAVYACLTRNRDENGNGYIDIDEMRWYLAGIDQLQYLYIGERVISADAKLYPNNALFEEAGNYHYLSSTYDRGYGQVLCAEEGLSITSNTNDWDAQSKNREETYYTPRFVRCLRNLGNDSNALDYVGEGDDGMSPLTIFSDNTIIPTFINADALRTEIWVRSTRPHEDLSELNIPYYGGFVVSEDYSRDQNNNLQQYTSSALEAALNAETVNCPEGYRVPNQREIALMKITMNFKSAGDDNTYPYTLSSTYNWYKTANQKNRHAYALISSSGYMTVENEEWQGYVRCIKDVDAANPASAYTNGGSLTE